MKSKMSGTDSIPIGKDKVIVISDVSVVVLRYNFIACPLIFSGL